MAVLLQKAVRKRSSGKVAGFGPGGSGKSLTLALLEIALSKTYHKGAPVALFDTEAASDWLLDIFEIEGVELYRHEGRAFVDMRQFEREAREAGCCGLLVDSYSHPWADLQTSLKKRLGVKKLEFHHMQELQELWQEWVSQFLASPMHILLAGRLAYEWENEQDVETGRMGFHKSGTKMRSEKDAGYEPHLLFEMEAHRVMEETRTAKVGNRQKKTRVEKKAGGHFLHRLHVLKDRARILNGQMFEFKDINNYKTGDWKHVFEALKPHFDKIQTAAGVHDATESTRTSEALFDDRGDAAAYGQRVKKVRIAIEEFDGTLRKLWPGETAKEKALRALAIEKIFETRSWTAVESMPLERLEDGVSTLKLFEERARSIEGALTDAPETATLFDGCREQVRNIRDAAVM